MEKNEMVSTMSFAVFLANRCSYRACGSGLAPVSNCDVCAEPVKWECSSCGRIVDTMHLHSGYSYYSSINHRKASILMNESDTELFNRKLKTNAINNNNNNTRSGGGEVLT